jgi:cytochrome P450
MQEELSAISGGDYRPSGIAQILPRSYEEIPQIYAWLEQMRSSMPVFYDNNLGLWQVFRYEEATQVLNDYARFSSKINNIPGTFLDDTLIGKDPPDHRKLRNLVNLAFTPRAVAHLSDRIVQITQELLDEIKPRGQADIVSDIAFPLPAKVIADMLGVPGEDWDIFRRWASVDVSDPNYGNTDDASYMQSEMARYFSDLLKDRRRAPREDLVTALSVAEIDGERLSEYETVRFCMLLLAAGQETTKNLIADAILCFTDNPGTIEELIREPDLMPAAIEEVLRYLPPAWYLFRQSTTDVELGGQHIPANRPGLVWLASANRDPARFPDPNRFDIRRDNRHVAFGHGIHFCIGAPLARLEARIALPMMLAQLGNLQRVEGVPIAVHGSLVLMVGNLPVTFQGMKNA